MRGHNNYAGDSLWMDTHCTSAIKQLLLHFFSVFYMMMSDDVLLSALGQLEDQEELGMQNQRDEDTGDEAEDEEVLKFATLSEASRF